MERRIARLFQVLVIGGGMGAAPIGCGEVMSPGAGPDATSGGHADASMPGDAATPADAQPADATQSIPDGPALQVCFCNQDPQRCCAAVGVVKSGFECCWGTSC